MSISIEVDTDIDTAIDSDFDTDTDVVTDADFHIDKASKGFPSGYSKIVCVRLHSES